MEQRNPKNRHPGWQKPKTKDWIGEKPQTAQDTKTEKPQFLSAQTEKLNAPLHYESQHVSVMTTASHNISPFSLKPHIF